MCARTAEDQVAGKASERGQLSSQRGQRWEWLKSPFSEFWKLIKGWKFTSENQPDLGKTRKLCSILTFRSLFPSTCLGIALKSRSARKRSSLAATGGGRLGQVGSCVQTVGEYALERASTGCLCNAFGGNINLTTTTAIRLEIPRNYIWPSLQAPSGKS